MPTDCAIEEYYLRHRWKRLAKESQPRRSHLRVRGGNSELMPLSCPVARFFPTNVDRLLHRGTHCALVVSEVDRVDAVNGTCLSEFLSYPAELLLVQCESGVECGATGLLEPDSRRLVPYLIAGPQVLDQHQHIHRVDGAVHASAENGPYIVPCAPVERDIKTHLTKVFGDVLETDPRSPIARPQVVQSSHQ